MDYTPTFSRMRMEILAYALRRLISVDDAIVELTDVLMDEIAAALA